MTPELTEIAPGVLRLTWSEVLPQEELRAAVGEIRTAMEAAFAGGAHRIEVHVAPGDELAQRVVTLGGFHREGTARGLDRGEDRVVYSRLVGDVPVDRPGGFRSLLNSFLPRKRAISQLLIRTTDTAPEPASAAHPYRVLLCQLTYKADWDLPGGVVEVGESPQLAVAREVEEELGLSLDPGPPVLTDWLPPWSGWDDAVCLVFDGGVHEASLLDTVIRQEREIRSAAFCTLDEVHERCADFTARRVEAALRSLAAGSGAAYTESGR